MKVIDAKYIRERLPRRRGAQADLARATGIDKDKITKILSGKRRVQADELPALEAYFASLPGPRQDSDARNGRDGEPEELVPVFDVSAAAGHGRLVTSEDPIRQIAFSMRYLREMTSAKGRDLAIIRVKGDSMEPTLLDDDLVLIDRAKRSLDFDGLFVLREGEALLVKRIGRGRNRETVTLISDNRLYPPIEKSRQDIDEVLGKVLWYGRKV